MYNKQKNRVIFSGLQGNCWMKIGDNECIWTANKSLLIHLASCLLRMLLIKFSLQALVGQLLEFDQITVRVMYPGNQ
jgi:hypothetical protein